MGTGKQKRLSPTQKKIAELKHELYITQMALHELQKKVDSARALFII